MFFPILIAMTLPYDRKVVGKLFVIAARSLLFPGDASEEICSGDTFSGSLLVVSCTIHPSSLPTER